MYKIKEKQFIFLFLIYFIFSSNNVNAGDRVGNGGGIAEQNINYAYLNLHTILNNCISSLNCLKTDEQRKLVQKILVILPTERKNPAPFEFLSGALHPEIFMINGSPRTAVTGNKVGDKIYINTDLIYYDNIKYGREPISIASAMGLLTHELGHHLQVTNHDFLDLIGGEIKAFALTSTDILKTDSFMDISDVKPPELVLTAVHSKLYSDSSLNGAESTLLFSDEQKIHNLNPWLETLFNTCPIRAQMPPEKMIGYRLYNIRWGKWTINSNQLSHRIYRVIADVSLYCEKYDDLEYPVRFDNGREIIFELPIKLIGQKWLLKTEDIKLKLLPSDP